MLNNLNFIKNLIELCKVHIKFATFERLENIRLFQSYTNIYTYFQMKYIILRHGVVVVRIRIYYFLNKYITL